MIMVLGWKHSIIDNRLDLELFKLDGGRVEGELHGEHQDLLDVREGLDYIDLLPVDPLVVRPL